MLQVTIKDLKTGETVYDEQVSMVVMQAKEKDGVRSLRHTSEDVDLPDVLMCIAATRKAASDFGDILPKALDEAIARVCAEKDEDSNK